jgi:hypothetical protein
MFTKISIDSFLIPPSELRYLFHIGYVSSSADALLRSETQPDPFCFALKL